MGSVEPLCDEQGKIRGYQARWRDENGKPGKKNFLARNGLRKVDATRHMYKMERGKTENEDPDLDKEVTVTELIEQYINLRAPDLAESSVDAMKRRLNNHIRNTDLGKMSAAKVRWSHVQGWATEMRQGSSESLVKVTLVLVSSGLYMAIRDGKIKPQSATQRINIKEDTHIPFEVLEVADVAAILAELDPHARIVAHVQAHTGARVQEALGLLASGTGDPVEVDLPARMIRLRMQMVRREPGRRQPLKKTWCRRDIPIGDVLTELLTDHFAAHGTAEGFAFAGPDGRPWSYDSYSGRIERAAVRAGFPGTSTHDLRHHHASVLINANVPALVIAKRLGHRGITQLEQTYGHLMKSSENMTREATDGAWRGAIE